MEAVKWNRATSKREQGVITPKRPKSKRQLKAAERIAQKLEAADVSADM